MNQPVIIVRIWEGLGNQLFQYAYARALKERGIDVRLDLNKAYDAYFVRNPKHDVRQSGIQNFNISLPVINVEEYGRYQYIRRDDIRNCMIYHMATHGLWKYGFYEERVDERGRVPRYCERLANIKGNYYIKGWFQDEIYFTKIRGVLRKELQPRHKIAISKELKQALEYPESVSVHVRRGDYVRVGMTLNERYYRASTALMRRKYKEPLFLIFSDDLEWTKRNMKFAGDCIYVNEDRRMQDYEELLVMSRCRSHIIANSTFSWWAAWLNSNVDKVVAAPRVSSLPEQRNMVWLS